MSGENIAARSALVHVIDSPHRNELYGVSSAGMVTKHVDKLGTAQWRGTSYIRVLRGRSRTSSTTVRCPAMAARLQRGWHHTHRMVRCRARSVGCEHS